MTEIAGDVPDYTTQLRANWQVLASSASVKAAGISIQKPTAAVVSSLPGIVTAALASAKPPLQLAKFAEIVGGKVTMVADDGSAATDSTLVHLVVSVITAGAQPPSAVTYQVAARPQAAPAGS